MRVAVLGCGPAGLAAVHAAFGLDAEVDIYAPMSKTPQLGPLVLQRPIPGINNDHPDGYIRQLVIGGTILDYRYKLYGDININIQGNQLREGYHVWNFVSTYDELFRRYILDPPPGIKLIPGIVQGYELRKLVDNYGLVISTAPLPTLCMNINRHQFQSQRVAVIQEHSYPDQPPDTTIFNGGESPLWVRSAILLGNESTEWRIQDAPTGARIIRKPILTTCDCFPRVLLTGRFGSWRNETWVDTAYWDTRDAMISADRKAIWANVS
jgi:hypothetical protein